MTERHSCDGCDSQARRDFLLDSLRAGAVLLASIGLSSSAEAMPVRLVSALACPHQNTALRWEADDHLFQCPKHKSRYTPEGVFIEGRATRSMDRYPVKLAGSAIVVDIDRVIQEDMEKAAWQQAMVTLP